MTNKEIIDAYNRLTPTKEEKEKMWKAISERLLVLCQRENAT